MLSMDSQAQKKQPKMQKPTSTFAVKTGVKAGASWTGN
jgi:hypothetical protein